VGTTCPFCAIDATQIVRQSTLAVALIDAFPVSKGHCLIVPRRHIASWFEASDSERAEILALLDTARDHVQHLHHPDGFNIGINDGAAAGQTVAHLHVHLIPRYAGDAADPRGGVRWVLPSKADYWTRS
jgi:diadenosine tetraphosphate (Ap4A) HIT family hydrolase